MRVQLLLPFLASLLFVSASPVGDTAAPEVIAVAVFPEGNQLGQIKNGQQNKLLVGIENKSGKNITITSIAGSIHHPETGKLIKNTSSLTYGLPLIDGAKISLPYTFYSEFKTGDRRLNVWVDHASPDGRYRVQAYDSVVSIVESSSSWLEPATLASALIFFGLLGALGYGAYAALAPPPKRVKKEVVSEPVAVTATGAGGYQEEWIPDGHIPKPRARRGKSGVTSGDEVASGAESGAEKRKTRRK